MRDAYFAATLEDFLATSDEAILGELTQAHNHSLEHQQRDAWRDQILYLRSALTNADDAFVFLEFSIPRMGKRADGGNPGRRGLALLLAVVANVAGLGWLAVFTPWVLRSLWIYATPRLDGKLG